MQKLLQPIIPYQELLGNYDVRFLPLGPTPIIPYQELLGNYDCCTATARFPRIISYQELLGNYDGRRVVMLVIIIIPY